MILTIIIGIIVAVCLVSTLVVYVLIRANEKSTLCNEKQKIKYTFTPSFDLITKRLPQRTSTSSEKSIRSSTGLNYDEERESFFRKASKSVESLTAAFIPMR